ncbi:MAG: single-stranded DNA-binding protein [bacterium]|nr:single-stranded DNA-binding protein [bacterium]
MTRDPELRYTPQGTAVCTFGLATNRTWTTDAGDKKEEVEFHRLVAWNKLAELCAQLLFKGRRIYVEGRLQTRSWTAQDGTNHQVTETVVSDMIILDSKRAEGDNTAAVEVEVPKDDLVEVQLPQEAVGESTEASQKEEVAEASSAKKGTKKASEEKKEKTADITSEDIPF